MQEFGIIISPNYGAANELRTTLAEINRRAGIIARHRE
jgi:hypothetical protein